MKKQMIIISPSKLQTESKPVDSNTPRPHTLSKAREIFGKIKPMSLEETKEMYSLSDDMATKVWNMHQNHGKEIFYAIECFNGTVFKQLELDKIDKEYLNDHVRIIDPLYGILKPFDTIGTYRLDYKVPFEFDIKEFWRETVNNELKDYEIINLASKEYSSIINKDMIEPKLEEGNAIKVVRGKTLNRMLINKEV